MKKRPVFLFVICCFLFITAACENPLVKPFYDRFKTEKESDGGGDGPGRANHTVRGNERALSPIDNTINISIEITELRETINEEELAMWVSGGEILKYHYSKGLIQDGSITLDVEVTYDGSRFINPKFTFDIYLTQEENITPVEGDYEYDYPIQVTIEIRDGLADYAGAEGEVDRRIPVTGDNIQRFNDFANEPEGLSRHYVLIEDTALPEPGESNWTPIGTGGNPFNGSFDGGEYTISGIVINNPDDDYQGMFGWIGSDGVVKNLTLDDCNITGKDHVGGVVGYSDGGEVTNSYFNNGTIEGTGNLIGGVVGTNNGGEVTDSHFNDSSVTSTGTGTGTGNIVGGVVGFNGEGGIVELCSATGSVTGTGTDIDTGNNIGGVVGDNSGTVTGSHFEGGIVEGVYNVGGVVGNNTLSGTVEGCEFTGTVTSSGNSIGGVVGYNNGTVKGSRFEGGSVIGITTATMVGGVVGYNLAGAEVIRCTAAGEVNGINNIGGVVGDNYGDVTDSHFNGDTVSGEGNTVGGIVAWNAGTVSGSHFNGGSVTGTGNNIGGIVGMNNGSVTGSHFEGNSVEGSSSYVGGIVGWNGEFGNLDKCHSTGSVTGKRYTGGVVGDNAGGTVKNSYTTGNVTGEGDYVGGVVGANESLQTYDDTFIGTVKNCYSTGNVTGYDNVGGVVGLNNGNNTIRSIVQNCYATGDVEGSIAGGVVGRNDGTVQYCYSTGGVSGDGNSGGIAGGNGDFIANCVALNPSVKTDEPFVDIRRVVGFAEGSTLDNNYAWKDMKVNEDTITDGTTGDKNGADVDAISHGGTPNNGGYSIQDFWTATMGWSFGSNDDSPWTWGPDNYLLPVLYWQTSYPVMPEHLE
ncbi:MAG: hypothetical protein FWG99_02465 [Treponema sp.]|nr:hypothetical protein [Treponema sp.]